MSKRDMSEQPLNIPYDALMIGATLNILAQTLNRRVARAAHERGFIDFRAAFHPVFQWCRTEGSRLTELAERAGVTKPSMSEIVDVMERLGYVERVPDPRDRRATLIRRTPRGWEINRIARDTIEAAQDEWRRALGEDEFAQLLSALRRLTRLAIEPAGASE
ncbi:MAG TPA: MarR family winged helix-turn-helix transcriptional regulator [Ktedonobacterales bacterium]|nr:MarR family winged helix-turn-helix transcriptional regulator [Ktedonobacterales bacterium]